MGSAAPAAAVSYLVRQPEFPYRDNEVLLKKHTTTAEKDLSRV